MLTGSSQLDFNSLADEILPARKLEADLYQPIASALREWWAPKEQITDCIVETTARQGSRNTGGIWSRPDIVTIGACAFPFLPGKTLDLSTFEVKPSISEGLTGVFETAAHSVFAHRSYLVIKGLTPERMQYSQEFTRIESECKRFGIGLILFFDERDWRTYEVIVESAFNHPAPSRVNNFIATQISEVSRQRLLTMFR